MKIKDLSGTERLQIYNVAKIIRKWFEEHYGCGVNLAGHCIEASELIVDILHSVGMEQVRTQEGYVKYDDPKYADDPYEPHMWVEVLSGSQILYLDITGDQFNYGMDPENKFPDIIFKPGYPHGVSLEKPEVSD